MKKVLNGTKKAGSKRMNEPRLIGSIVAEMLDGNSPLAHAYRDRLFNGVHPHTEPCVDLKLLTKRRGRMPVGKVLDGVLAHDEEQHFTFVEGVPKVSYRRYPMVFSGFYVNVHRHDDGTLHPSLKRVAVTEDFDIEGYAKVVALELNRALSSLVGKK